MPGPPPGRHTRRANKEMWRQLPAGGRQGEPPEFPLQRPSKAVLALWADLWATPQADAWESLGWTRVVARYAKKTVESEKSSAPVSLLAEVRQLEDRLGLNPMSMRRLFWEIVADEPVAAGEQPSNVTSLDDYRELYGSG